MEGLSQIGVAGSLEVHLGYGLLVRGKLAAEEHVVLEEKLAVMAHAEFGHLVLYFNNAGQASAFLHHLHHALVLEFGRHVAPVLHEFSEPHVLSRKCITLWQT